MASLLESGFKSSHGIIPALDSETLDEIKAVVAATTRITGVVGYKVGLTAVLRLGLAKAVQELRGVTDLPLIYDHEKAGPDVPDMAAKFTAICREAGVDGLILFPVAGPRAVREFAGGALRNGLPPSSAATCRCPTTMSRAAAMSRMTRSPASSPTPWRWASIIS